jgi:hypothetical protein
VSNFLDVFVRDSERVFTIGLLCQWLHICIISLNGTMHNLLC